MDLHEAVNEALAHEIERKMFSPATREVFKGENGNGTCRQCGSGMRYIEKSGCYFTYKCNNCSHVELKDEPRM